MKTDLSLSALATEIERRRTAKQDFVAPTTKLEMLPETNDLAFETSSDQIFAVNDVAHKQIA